TAGWDYRAIAARAGLCWVILVATLEALAEAGADDLVEALLGTGPVVDREVAVGAPLDQGQQARAGVELLEFCSQQRLGLGLAQAGTRRQPRQAQHAHAHGERHRRAAVR